jgi:hypothetical protein
MPLGFNFYPDIQLLFIRGEGVITQSERVLTMLAWLQDPAYERCLDALFDISAAQSTPKLAELRELIGILERHVPSSGPRKLAIVTSNPITFALARIFGDLMQIEGVPLEVKVFFDREKAWGWLRPDALPEQS